MEKRNGDKKKIQGTDGKLKGKKEKVEKEDGTNGAKNRRKISK